MGLSWVLAHPQQWQHLICYCLRLGSMNPAETRSWGLESPRTEPNLLRWECRMRKREGSQQPAHWCQCGTVEKLAPMAHACNPIYLGSWDREDHGWRSAWASSFQDSISKITRSKWAGGVAQSVEYLLCKVWSPEFKTQSHKKKGRKERKRQKESSGRLWNILPQSWGSSGICVQTSFIMSTMGQGLIQGHS
jgi:hypothetical protein